MENLLLLCNLILLELGTLEVFITFVYFCILMKALWILIKVFWNFASAVPVDYSWSERRISHNNSDFHRFFFLYSSFSFQFLLSTIQRSRIKIELKLEHLQKKKLKIRSKFAPRTFNGGFISETFSLWLQRCLSKVHPF